MTKPFRPEILSVQVNSLYPSHVGAQTLTVPLGLCIVASAGPIIQQQPGAVPEITTSVVSAGFPPGQRITEAMWVGTWEVAPKAERDEQVTFLVEKAALRARKEGLVLDCEPSIRAGVTLGPGRRARDIKRADTSTEMMNIVLERLKRDRERFTVEQLVKLAATPYLAAGVRDAVRELKNRIRDSQAAKRRPAEPLLSLDAPVLDAHGEPGEPLLEFIYERSEGPVQPHELENFWRAAELRASAVHGPAGVTMIRLLRRNLSIAEVARALRTSPDTVRRRLVALDPRRGRRR